MQNHDQVGNRAIGDRLSTLAAPEPLRVATALLLLSPQVPLLFMGEEWNSTQPFLYFTDHDDPELGKAVTEGRRREFAAFGWDPDEVPDPHDPETVRRSKLIWDVLGEKASSELVRAGKPEARAAAVFDREAVSAIHVGPAIQSRAIEQLDPAVG